MEYPPGHVSHVSHHRHHNRREDDDDEENNNNAYPPPPPPFSHSHSPYPPPPSYGGGGGGGGGDYPPPPSYGAPPPHQPSYDNQYPPSHHYPPAQQPQPHLESPNYPQHETAGGHHRFQPHVPDFIGSHFHHDSAAGGGGGSTTHHSSSHGGGGLGSLESKPSLQFRCKAGGDRYAVGIRDGKVVLTHPDSSDLTQHWCKDERYSTKVKDKDGYPSFILVNKGTAQAVKHSVSCHPVALTPYHPDVFDESVLWTEGKDLGSGFRTIRTVNNIHLVMDAWNADKDHGGIHDGTLLALYETWKGDNQNQQWKFTRH